MDNVLHANTASHQNEPRLVRDHCLLPRGRVAAIKLQTNVPLEVLQQRFTECHQRPTDFSSMREETGALLWFRGAKAPAVEKTLPQTETMFRMEPEAVELSSTSSVT